MKNVITKNSRFKIAVLLLFLLQSFASGQNPETTLLITGVEDYPGLFGQKKIQYEKVTGRFIGELNPSDRLNKIITDIQLADKNFHGMVEYGSDFIILKPKDMSLSNGIIRYDAPNRGGFGLRADSIFLARGYVILIASWQGDVEVNQGATGFSKKKLDVPVARNADGSSITGIIRVEFAPRSGTHPSEMALSGNVYNSGHIPYIPAGFPSNDGCVLTKRKMESDPRRFISNNDWAFSSTNEKNPFPGTPDSMKISLKGGFDPDYLYELIYTGKDPKVMGVGLAAIRDIVTFFRNAQVDSKGTKNPLAGKIKYAFGTGNSQSGNFMKTFIHLGFNENLQGEKVFDAIFPTVGARQTNINMRFAVPGGGGGPRTEHRAYGQASVRAFSPDYYDAIADREGGIFSRSEQSGTTPKVFLLFTSAEMWSLQCSPVFHDAYGQKDLEQPADLRIYYIAGAQHSIGSSGQIRWDPSGSIYPGSSIVDGSPVLTALWFALEDWIVKGIEPPASQIPLISNKSLVFPEDLKFPVMRGVTMDVQGKPTLIPEFKYTGLINELSLLDFGPQFNEYDESGIATLLPPAYLGKDYAIMVSQIDSDGNEIAGIRTVELLAPTGTSLGFNYDARTDLGDLYGLNGSFIPFHTTRAERLIAGDTRLSLEERYGSHEGYVLSVKKAVEKLVNERLLLPEDGQKKIKMAENSNILKNK